MDLLEPILKKYFERCEAMGALAHQAWLDHCQPSRPTAFHSDKLLRCMRSAVDSWPPAVLRRW